MFAFDYENHTKHLTESIQGLFIRNVLVDCTLSAEGQFINGHQVILAACSPYFELLFSQKQDRKPVFLKDVKFKDLKSLVDFMYFGEVYIPTEQLNSFVETAKALQVKGLTNLYKNENNVECSDGSKFNVKNKCEKKKWNFCEKTFEIKTESESQSSTSGTFEIEKCAELNYNAYFSGALKMEYEENCSAVSLLPFIKEENESYLQYDSNRSNVSNRNDVDHCPVDIETVVKGEIEIEENKLNFHENHEVTNLSEITSNDALLSTSQDSLYQTTAVCVISDADTYKDFNVNLENNSFEFVSTSPKSDVVQESRESGGDNYILGLENVDLKERSSNSYGQGEESRSNDSGPKHYLPHNTVSLRNVDTEGAKLCENSDKTGLLEDTAILEGHGTRIKKNQYFTFSNGTHVVTPLNTYISTISRKAPYQCTHCSKVFSDNNKLQTHTHVHRKELQYECKLCFKRFFDSIKLERHLSVHAGRKKINLLTHSDEKINHCTVCSKKFTRTRNLKQHLLTHSGKKNYECTLCLRRFTLSGHLKRHLLTHSGEKKYVCNICPKRFIQSGDLKRHLLTHSGEKKYVCNICLKRFTGSGDLKRHLLTHSGEKKYMCTICLKRFTLSWHLKQHLLTHSGKKNYVCTVCSKRFSQSGHLKEHLLIHGDKKNYVCTVCLKRFTRSGDLKKHLLTHSGEKNYECSVCLKRFTQSGQLKRHLRKHTVCAERFTRSEHFNSHQLTHSGEEEMYCAHCSKVFSSKERLIDHLRVHD